jgi:transcription antitermination factor NusG
VCLGDVVACSGRPSVGVNTPADACRGVIPLQNWLVANSRPNQELYAAGFLERWSVESYVPKYRVQAARTHHTRVFFPGYLFVLDQPDVDPVSVQYVPGITRLVRSGNGSFARVADEVIRRLKNRETPDGYIQMDYRVGDRIRVSKPPFDVVGVFQGLKDSERAIVLLNMLGSSRVSVVDLRYLKKAA